MYVVLMFRYHTFVSTVEDICVLVIGKGRSVLADVFSDPRIIFK